MSITVSARRNGKTAQAIEAIKAAAARGEHVHIHTRSGLRCIGSDDCTAERSTVEQVERELREAR